MMYIIYCLSHWSSVILALCELFIDAGVSSLHVMWRCVGHIITVEIILENVSVVPGPGFL